jgi:hypothetical protein
LLSCEDKEQEGDNQADQQTHRYLCPSSEETAAHEIVLVCSLYPKAGVRLCFRAVARIYWILSVAIGAFVDQNVEDGRMELARQDWIWAHSRAILDSGDSFRDAWTVGGEIDLDGFLTRHKVPGETPQDLTNPSLNS